MLQLKKDYIVIYVFVFSVTDIEVTTKNIVVSSEKCKSAMCVSCMAPQCQLCLPCLTADTLHTLRLAYREHTSRHDCKRVFPPSMVSHLLMNTKLCIQAFFKLTNFNFQHDLKFYYFKNSCECSVFNNWIGH